VLNLCGKYLRVLVTLAWIARMRFLVATFVAFIVFDECYRRPGSGAVHIAASFTKLTSLIRRSRPTSRRTSLPCSTTYMGRER
jgi:hypothetical protein